MHKNCPERFEYNLLTVIISGELDWEGWLNEGWEYCFSFYVLYLRFLLQVCVNLAIKIRGKQNKMKKTAVAVVGSFYCLVLNLSLPPTDRMTEITSRLNMRQSMKLDGIYSKVLRG